MHLVAGRNLTNSNRGTNYFAEKTMRIIALKYLHKVFTIFIMLFAFNHHAIAAENVVNIYSWSGYIPQSVLKAFTKETGIKINLSEYDNNETLYAKLKTSPHAGYDIIVPSSYFVQRMLKQNMLAKIDKTQLPNYANLNPLFLHKNFDPNNDYSVPYLWGSSGITINTDYFKPHSVTSWEELWNPKYKNQLMMLSDPREVFAIALFTLGYSVNDTNPKHIEEAYLKLKKLLPNVKIFNSDAEQTIYIDEDAVIGMAWNGDINLSQAENPKLKFIYPKEGFVLWIDCIAITKNAPHLENAHKLINFLLRPEIAKQISMQTGYSTPNLKAIELLPQEMQNNPIFNPSQETLSRGQLQEDLGATLATYEKYWELLKIGG
jgi:spermidine/putrescine transport system substrate-binding protein